MINILSEVSDLQTSNDEQKETITNLKTELETLGTTVTNTNEHLQRGEVEFHCIQV